MQFSLGGECWEWVARDEKRTELEAGGHLRLWFLLSMGRVPFVSLRSKVNVQVACLT